MGATYTTTKKVCSIFYLVRSPQRLRSERKCVAVGACRARLPPPKRKKKTDASALSLPLLSPPYGLIVLPCCCCLCSSSSCRRSCGQSYNNFCHSLSRHCRAYLVSPSPPTLPTPAPLLAFGSFLFFSFFWQCQCHCYSNAF